MTRKTNTPPTENEIEDDVAGDVETPEAPNEVVADERYDVMLTKTVKHAGEWHCTVLKGIGVDFAAALQAAGAGDITPSEIARA